MAGPFFPQRTHFRKDWSHRIPSALHVPRVSGDHASRTDHAGHLGNAFCRLGHKEDDERHGGGIKSFVGEWKCHRVALAEFRNFRGVSLARELDLLR